jgi:hypothetical protein
VIYPYGLSGTSLTGASVLASKDAKRVAITATVPISLLSELVLQGSAPLSENEPRSAVVQLDGLANKGKFGAEWRYGQQRLPSAAAMTALIQGLWKLCQPDADKPSTSPQPPEDDDITDVGCDLTELRKSKPEATKLLETYFPSRGAWFVTVKGDVATETFQFSDKTTFADAKERKWSGSGALIGGWLTPNNTYLSASLRFDRTHEAAKSQAVCTITELGKTTACPNKVVGGPTDKTLKITEAEVRKYLKPIGGLNIGASAILRRDWEKKNTSFEAPLYFIKDKDGGLSGGISSGYIWSSDDTVKGPRFTVFVGQAFSLGG